MSKTSFSKRICPTTIGRHESAYFCIIFLRKDDAFGNQNFIIVQHETLQLSVDFWIRINVVFPCCYYLGILSRYEVGCSIFWSDLSRRRIWIELATAELLTMPKSNICYALKFSFLSKQKLNVGYSDATFFVRGSLRRY